MKKKIIALILIIMAAVLTGCGAQDATKDDQRVLSAQIRYFDGSMETILLESYFVGKGGSYLILNTDAGRRLMIGINNVLIINETEDQYNNTEEYQ